MDPVEEQLAAYNARDVERFLAAYSSDVVIEDGEDKVLMKGHDQMRAGYSALFAASPELHCRVAARMRVGKYVVDEEEVTGWNASPTPVHAVVVYRVEGGQDRACPHARVSKVNCRHERDETRRKGEACA